MGSSTFVSSLDLSKRIVVIELKIYALMMIDFLVSCFITNMYK